MKRIFAKRDQLIEWIRCKSGELSLQEVSDDTLVLMAGGLELGDVVVTETGEYVKRASTRPDDLIEAVAENKDGIRTRLRKALR